MKNPIPSYLHTRILVLGLLGAVSLFGSLMRGDIAHAINVLLEWYRVVPSIATTIDTTTIGGDCKKVTPPAWLDRFVPTKTLAEWNGFKSAAPWLGIGLGPCTGGSCVPKKYVKWMGSTDYDSSYAWNIAADNLGNSYITGKFVWTTDAFWSTMTSSGNTDIYLVKTDSSWSVLWSKKAGGSWYDAQSVLTVDISGNVYVAGIFDTSANIFWQAVTGVWGWNIFLAKLDANGNLLWVQQTNGGIIYWLKVDSSWNIYAMWVWWNGLNLFWQTLVWSYDIFAAKLNSSGNGLWIKWGFVWGNVDTVINSIALDTSNNLYIIWGLRGVGNVFWQSLSSSNSNDSDIFLAKLDNAGNLVWAQKAGWSSGIYEYGNNIAIDTSGNIYIAWAYDSYANIFGINISNTGWDGFVAKLNTSWNALWVKSMNSSRASADWINVDTSWNVYVTGYFLSSSTIFGQSLTGNGFDIVASKLANNGNLLWNKIWGWAWYDNGLWQAIDGVWNIYVTWYYTWPATIFWVSLLAQGGGERFLAKLDPSGNTVEVPWVERAASAASDSIKEVDISSDGSIYTLHSMGTGSSFGTFYTGSSGFISGTDLLLTKHSSTWVIWQSSVKAGTPYWSTFPGYIDTDPSWDIMVTWYVPTGTVSVFGSSVNVSQNMILAKVSKTTGQLIWHRDAPYNNAYPNFTVDSGGNTIIVSPYTLLIGSTGSYFGATLGPGASYNNWYVIKLSPSWSILWSRTVADVSVNTVTNDIAGNIYVQGNFQWTQNIFGTTLVSAGSTDVFVVKLDPSGNTLWVKQWWWVSPEIGLDIDIDVSGDIIVAGTYYPPATMFGVSLPSSSSYNPGYVVKLNPNTGNPIWGYTTSGNNEQIRDISLDQSRNIYVSADFYLWGKVFFKLDPSGVFQWEKYLSSTQYYNSIASSAVNAQGEIYIVGEYGYNDQNVSFAWVRLPSIDGSPGEPDIFMVRLTASGTLTCQ